MSNITIVDIAKRAGVGIGTVSRVLNNNDAVGANTAKAVRQAIADMGYVRPPDEHRRGPRGSRGTREPAVSTKIVLLILGQHGLRWVLDCAPVYSYVLAGIESALNKAGRCMTVRQTPTWEQASKVVKEEKAKGVILFGREPEGGLPSAIEKLATAWVMGSPRRYLADHITSDHLRVGAIAAEWAIGHGHHVCAYLGSGTGSMKNLTGFRADTFCSEIKENNGSVQLLLDPAITLVDKGLNGPNEPVLSAMIDRLAAAVPRPTVLFLQADMYTPSIYRNLLERGIQPGKDITVITCNNERPYLAGLHPAPVIIDTRGEAIGRRAVEQLLWRMDNRGEPAMHVMVEPKLILPE